MPLPILILVTVKAAADATTTSMWIYVGMGSGGTILGGAGIGGLYYYRDRFYRWWYPDDCRVLEQDDAIQQQLSNMQSAKNSVNNIAGIMEQSRELTAISLADMQQDAAHTATMVNEVDNLAVVVQLTFEALLQKITDDRCDKLTNVLNVLENIAAKLSPEQVKIAQTMMDISKENCSLRETNQKQQRIIVKLDKINAMLQQHLSSDNGAETVFRRN